jgi:uncharacterized protein
MARVDRLPPPPRTPVRSPPANVTGEEAAVVPGIDGGPELEARVRAPAGATRGVVLCHPHPLYGGSMHSPVPLAIAKRIAEARGDAVAVLRFNFRGVGGSAGAYDDGRGEVDDVRAALAELRGRSPRARITVCGHSFGSWVGLNAARGDGGVDRVALVAPSTRFFSFDAAAARGAAEQIAIFIGDQDEFCDVPEARALASALDAEITVLEGFDHHFTRSRRALADTVLPFVAPERGPGGAA